MNDRFVIGVDYGTESGRAVLVNTATGDISAAHVETYPHGIMTERLPGGEALPPRFALQHPGDYLHVLRKSVPSVLKSAGVRAEQVIGIGVDFTSCTMLPVDAAFRPLCFTPEWAGEPHAWVKLWKHHAAERETQLLNGLSAARHSPWIHMCGGSISVESMHPKCLQIWNEAPELYKAADLFMEAGDWVVAQLTGKLTRNRCSAGFKSFWHEEHGYPAADFFTAIDPGLADYTQTKLRGPITPVGGRAGGLTEDMAAVLGLRASIPVASAMIDAHAAVLGAGVSDPDTMVMVMGTSTCFLLLSGVCREIAGISGVVKDSILPGYYGYEAGQSAVGDTFGWFVRSSVPSALEEEAKRAGVTVHESIEQLASALKPGQSGLLALDWFNGNRSPLSDADLSGCIVGCTLATKPEELYRALLEATAFGAKDITENYRSGGLDVRRVYACGGLPHKNRLLMQIYADVLGIEICVSSSPYASAVGAAILGAVAAGEEHGGYRTVDDAVRGMGGRISAVYKPVEEHAAVYAELYREYAALRQYFGQGGNPVMKRLLHMKNKPTG